MHNDNSSIDNDSAIFVESANPAMHSYLQGYEGFTPEEQQAHNLEAIEQAQDEISIDTATHYTGSDAGYETDSLQSVATSVKSVVYNYAWENGRRYHKFREGAYNFPNDEHEQDREDMKHAMLMNLCQTLHFAPIGPNPQRIMDMGCGTGLWAIEMGDLYLMADIIGVDLSPIQPSWIPPNVQFTLDDLESSWLRPTNHFDYIHSRHMVMAIKDWPKLLRKTLEYLKPGGWLELQEMHHFPQCHDGSMPVDYPVARFWSLIFEALAVLGVNIQLTLQFADMMREAGFVNVSTRIFHIPIGTWPRNRLLKFVGAYWRTILIDGAEPIALGPLTRGLKWPKEEVDVLLQEVKDAYQDGSSHTHMPLYIVCGQKSE